MGYAHVCAISDPGVLSCWGDFDQYGDHGNGPDPRDSPQRISGGWSLVSSAADRACGIRHGELFCWGGEGGDFEASTTPARIGEEADWISLAVGPLHACAIRAGELYCWGSNYAGQLGIGSVLDREAPTRVGDADDWEQVSVELLHSCGIRAGALYCWGTWPIDNTSDARLVPVRHGEADDWVQVAVGSSEICAIRTGRVWCWGVEQTQAELATRVGSGSGWDSIFASSRSGGHCALRAGELSCWGESALERVGDDADWESVALDFHQWCGIRADGVYC
jgi:alpha-tubulin suppressor-like RCC1 family protein